MEDRRIVKIACNIQNGVVLHLFTHTKGEMGEPRVLRDGATVRLAGPVGVMGGTNQSPSEWPAVITEVDAEWWEKWKAQNIGKNALLDHGAIREWQENPTSSRP